MESNGTVVHARPSKSFFIDMLTRDITVTDCILDLVDNAIDKAVQTYGIDVMDVLTKQRRPKFPSNAKISLHLSADTFRIEDRCGGISVDDAREEVFKFGNIRPPERGGGLGVYGIGMKRAFFKIGRKIVLESATEKEHFRIDFDVDQWRKDDHDNWDLAFANVGTVTSPSQEKAFTKIEITRFTAALKDRVTETSFANSLRERTGSTYGLFLQAGLEILINGKQAESKVPDVGTGTYKPASTVLKKSGVDILIIAGVTPRSDKVPHGWYVFCNGRMVLMADKTADTGWGDLLPGFHSKYNHFVGYLYLRSDNVSALPWTTTKRGVDTENPIYRYALKEMKVQAIPILNHLSRLYPGDPEAEDIPERAALDKAEATSVEKVAKTRSTFEVKVETKAPSGDTLKSIQYKRRLKDINRVRRRLGDQDLALGKVGEATFDYYLEREC